MENLRRAEAHLRRQMNQAISTLRQLQKDRKAGNRPGAEKQASLVQNEPILPDPTIPPEALIHGYILPAIRPVIEMNLETPPKAA